jgi:hypothetical protein
VSDLARQLVADPRWRWVEGMANTRGAGEAAARALLTLWSSDAR